MILYTPVPITSTEQAEALPVGTVSLERVDGATFASVKVGPDEWHGTGEAEPYRSRHMPGDVALVPVEARRQHGWDVIDPAAEEAPSTHARRYVTEWAEQ